MSPTESDFKSLGLTPSDWQALILGRGQVPNDKLDNARVVLARIGGYGEKWAGDLEFMNRALIQIATNFPQFWLKGETLSHDEKVMYLRLKHDWSVEEAEKHLAQVAQDQAEVARIFGGG